MADVGSAVSGGLSIIGGMSGSDSAGDAYAAQEAGSQLNLQYLNKALDEIKSSRSQTRKDYAPYRAVGQEAILSLADMMGVDFGSRLKAESSVDLSGIPKTLHQEGYDIYDYETGEYYGRASSPGVRTYTNPEYLSAVKSNRQVESEERTP